jgi:ATP-binding cassette subfamily C protein
VLGWAAWRRINRLLSEAPADEAERPRRAEDGLVLDGVTVCAGGRTLLDGLSFAVPPGTLLGVAGPNGAGKSTLLRLIAGLTRPDAGEARLDGVVLHDPTRRPAGYLPQGVALLDGTVAENVTRFGGDLPAAIGAAQLAGVHDTIGRLPKGYDTALQDGGAALPGGIRQRIGLARAVHATPRLVVLDEPDASLDHDGTQALRQALEALRGTGAVVVITTHRPALIAAMDQVLVLEDGKLAAFGPPSEVAPPAATSAASPAISPPARAPHAVPARVTAKAG